MTSNKIPSKKLIFSFLIIFSVVILDQLTKAWVIKSDIAYACNTGFAFGTFPGLFNSLTTILTLLIVIYFFYTLGSDPQSTHFKKDPTLEKVLGFSLIIGGGASNIVDRLIRGCVIDFIDLKVWPAFNLADAAISVGVGILILSIVGGLKDEKT